MQVWTHLWGFVQDQTSLRLVKAEHCIAASSIHSVAMTAAAHPSAGQVADEAQVAAQHTQEQLERLTLEGGEKVLPLPPPPRDISGAQVHKEKNYHLTVSNTNGYLAHIVLDATFDGVPPGEEHMQAAWRVRPFQVC